MSRERRRMGQGVGLIERQRFAVTTILAAVLLGVSAPAQAQPSEADKDRAGQLMLEGDKRFGQGEYPAALQAYRKADEIMKVPTTRMAVARTLAKLGRLIEARETAVQVSKLPVGDGEPLAFTRARAEAAPLIVDLDSRIPSLLLRLSPLPSGVPVELKLDGETVPQERMNLPRKLDPGAHTIVLAAAGHEEEIQRITLQEGETKQVELRLGPKQKPKASGSLERPQAQLPSQQPVVEEARSWFDLGGEMGVAYRSGDPRLSVGLAAGAHAEIKVIPRLALGPYFLWYNLAPGQERLTGNASFTSVGGRVRFFFLDPRSALQPFAYVGLGRVRATYPGDSQPTGAMYQSSVPVSVVLREGWFWEVPVGLGLGYRVAQAAQISADLALRPGFGFNGAAYEGAKAFASSPLGLSFLLGAALDF